MSPSDPPGGAAGPPRRIQPDEFEHRVRSVPDLELSPFYWNWLLPETTGRALWHLFIVPALRGCDA